MDRGGTSGDLRHDWARGYVTQASAAPGDDTDDDFDELYSEVAAAAPAPAPGDDWGSASFGMSTAAPGHRTTVIAFACPDCRASPQPAERLRQFQQFAEFEPETPTRACVAEKGSKGHSYVPRTPTRFPGPELRRKSTSERSPVSKSRSTNTWRATSWRIRPAGCSYAKLSIPGDETLCRSRRPPRAPLSATGERRRRNRRRPSGSGSGRVSPRPVLLAAGTPASRRRLRRKLHVIRCTQNY